MAPFTSSGPFPVANGTLSFWQTDPDRLANYRSTELLPEESDVLIIGSGISGTSVAYHLLKDNPNPPSITILEARQACSGATGRNGTYPLLSALCTSNRMVDSSTKGAICVLPR